MKLTSKTKDVKVAAAIKPGSLVDEYKVQSYLDEAAQLIQRHIDRGRGPSEVRQLQKIAGILKEDQFYAPDYIVQKYGEDKAKKIEQNIFDAEEMENNPNLWDLFTSLETPQEVDEFIKGYTSI
jgi:hypothetical protein